MTPIVYKVMSQTGRTTAVTFSLNALTVLFQDIPQIAGDCQSRETPGVTSHIGLCPVETHLTFVSQIASPCFLMFTVICSISYRC